MIIENFSGTGIFDTQTVHLQKNFIYFNAGLSPSKKIIFICFTESSL